MGKRAFDVSLSALGLLISSPLWAIIALAVKAEDGGSVFFAQSPVLQRKTQRWRRGVTA